MEKLAELLERNAQINQELFELNKNAIEAGLEMAHKAIAANSELFVQFAKDMLEAKSAAEAVETAVEASTKASKLAAEQTSEAVETTQKYTNSVQEVAKKAAGA